jgi:hypothetical protein
MAKNGLYIGSQVAVNTQSSYNPEKSDAGVTPNLPENIKTAMKALVSGNLGDTKR